MRGNERGDQLWGMRRKRAQAHDTRHVRQCTQTYQKYVRSRSQGPLYEAPLTSYPVRDEVSRLRQVVKDDVEEQAAVGMGRCLV